LAFAVEAVLLRFGLIRLGEPLLIHDIILVALMCIPAVGAFVAGQAVPHSSHEWATVWNVPVGQAIRIAVVVPCVFALIYGLTALFGWTDLQWRMGTLMTQLDAVVAGMTHAPLPPGLAAILPAILLVIGTILSAVLGATLFALMALGSELGWRGYLLPRLLPLGRFPAYLLTGVLWGLWFLPILYAWFSEIGKLHAMGGFLVRFLIVAVVLGAILGEIWRRTENISLVAIGLGCFAAQSSIGLWRYLFPSATPPWTGPFGIVAIAVWSGVAIAPGILLSPNAHNRPDPNTQRPEQNAMSGRP